MRKEMVKALKKRDRERDRYLKAHTSTFGRLNAENRWTAYERLIIGRYLDEGEVRVLEGDAKVAQAWINRDRGPKPKAWHGTSWLNEPPGMRFSPTP